MLRGRTSCVREKVARHWPALLEWRRGRHLEPISWVNQILCLQQRCASGASGCLEAARVEFRNADWHLRHTRGACAAYSMSRSALRTDLQRRGSRPNCHLVALGEVMLAGKNKCIYIQKSAYVYKQQGNVTKLRVPRNECHILKQGFMRHKLMNMFIFRRRMCFL